MALSKMQLQQNDMQNFSWHYLSKRLLSSRSILWVDSERRAPPEVAPSIIPWKIAPLLSGSGSSQARAIIAESRKMDSLPSTASESTSRRGDGIPRACARSFDGFDCVTLVNNVLALALPHDFLSFEANVLRLNC